MPKLSAEKFDVDGTVNFFDRLGGYDHLRARKHGALVVIESGPTSDPVPHARLRRVTKQWWTLEMPTHTGRWQKTPLRGTRLEILQALVDAMKPYSRHGVNVNVDFYAGVVYFLHGIPEDLFVPIFAIGRVPGWTVQVLEQLENNILIRPLTEYTGPEEREYVPIDQRS